MAFMYGMAGAGFLAAAAAAHSLLVRGLLLYAALPCVSLAAAYLARCPQVFMKRPDGRLGLASWLLFGSFHAANLAVLGFLRACLRRPRWHQIVPGLYLGEGLRGWDKPDWTPLPFHVLDMTAELAEAPWARASAAYCSIPVLDRTAPTPAQLSRGVEFIREHLERGSVYVHCAYGHSRSALVVAAYLAMSGRCKTAADAVALVQAKRPGAYLNRAQRACLEAVVQAPVGD